MVRLFLPCLSQLLLLGMICGGCASSSPASRKTPANSDPAAPLPVGLQLIRVAPELKQQRFNVLLGFESPTDGLFVSAEPGKAELVQGTAHSGVGSLKLPAGTRRVSVRLSSLLSGLRFPGDWTILGFYIRPTVDTPITISYESAPSAAPLTHSFNLLANQWNFAAVDITTLAAAGSDASQATLRLEFGENGLAQEAFVDNLMLIDNAASLVEETQGASPPLPEDAWSIRRRGFEIRGDSPGRFSFSLETAQSSPDGWTFAEANSLRARFTSTGKSKSFTIYRDGRAFRDGEYKPLCDQGKFAGELAAQHQSPADIEIPEELGRLDRTSAGDSNNDGYNEATGAYRLMARGPRLDCTLTPRSPSIVRPVLEIAGLPEGPLVVTVEGRLVDGGIRLANGNALIELPIRIDRPTSVNIRLR